MGPSTPNGPLRPGSRAPGAASRVGLAGAIALAALAALTALTALTTLTGCAGSAHHAGASTAAASGPAQTREVRIASGPLSLAGTVQVPKGSGRRPAVVLLHGSGPQSRDSALAGQLAMSFGCTIDLFEELADGLEAAGFVVLRYDKRTCGPFNDCADNGYPPPGLMHTAGELIADAAAAIRWLAAQPEVDPARIYAVGHSEGGVLVPRLLTDVAELRGGVLLATPHAPIDRVLEAQLERVTSVLTAQRMGGGELDDALRGLRALVAETRALRAGTFGGALVGGTPVVYWRSLMTLGDEAPALAAATPKPVLVLSGDYDWNVPPEETAAWAATFAAQPSAEHVTQVLPCVTHAQNCIRQPVPAKIRAVDIDCDVDERVIDGIARFLSAH